MEPDGSLPSLQQPATSHYPETDKSSPRPPSYLLKIQFITLPSTSSSSKLPFSFWLPRQNSRPNVETYSAYVTENRIHTTMKTSQLLTRKPPCGYNAESLNVTS